MMDSNTHSDSDLDEDLLNDPIVSLRYIPSAKSHIPSFNPDTFVLLPLRQQYSEAFGNYCKLSNDDSHQKLARADQALKQCLILWETVKRSMLFSENETVEEISSVDLKYLLVPFYVSKLYLLASQSDLDLRLISLKHSRDVSVEFLQLSNSIGLLKDFDLIAWKNIQKSLKKKEVDSEEEKHAKKETMKQLFAKEMEDQRNFKISQFKKKKENQLRLKKLEEKLQKKKQGNLEEEEDLNDLEREMLILNIEESIRETLSEFQMNLQEIDLLEQRQKLLEQSKQNPKSSSMTQTNENSDKKPSKVLKVDRFGRVYEVPLSGSKLPSGFAASTIDDRVRARTQLRETVFRNANPHTMSIEEIAEMEMQNMQVSAPEKTPQELEEEELQKERTEFMDLETMKAREWDNWKDDNERGIGNRLLR